MKRLFILVLAFTFLNIGSAYALTDHADNMRAWGEMGGILGGTVGSDITSGIGSLIGSLGWAPDKDCRLVTNASGEHLAPLVAITSAWSSSSGDGSSK
jgi:hypothetical protein